MVKTYKFLLSVLTVACFNLLSFSQQCNVIYVTPNGASTAGAGTRVNPASLTYGLSIANPSDNLIWMAEGNYPISAPLQLVSNVTLEGGFDPLTWIKSNATSTLIQKDASNVIPAPANALVALIGANNSNFRLQDLTITVADAITSQTSVYGIYLNGCSNYNIVRCGVIAGAGGMGATGATGVAGIAGATGGTGAAGATEPNPTTSGAGGTGGNAGGNGGVVNNYNPGAAGNGVAGSGPSGGTAGAGGSGTPCSLGCTLGPPGCNGTAGGAGGSGGPGTLGAAGAAGPAGTVSGLCYFIPGAAGGNGVAGTSGSGGGGGGQGGGQQENGSDDHGGSGGGGGGGGGGGTGGAGGTGGGGSFAVFLCSDAGGGSIVDCQLSAGAGGAGGIGGAGGSGGTGGTGGPGGTENPVCGSANTVGGAGGTGGAGGAGGAGGNGAAGPSIDLDLNGATVTQNNITSVPGNPPVIDVLNFGCTNAQVVFTAATAGAWNFGAGATPATGNGVGPVSVSYSSVGRKTITFSGTTFTDFVDIFDNTTFTNTITQSANPTTEGCPDIFTTSITGSMYYWYYGPSAIVPVDSGATLQKDTNYFIATGPTSVKVLVNTPCCGLVEDSLLVNVQTNALSITIVDTPATICQGSQIIFTADPTGYSSYSFFVDDSLVNTPTAANTFNYSLLKPGDSVKVVGFNGVCYTSPSATLYPTVYPIPAAAGLISSIPGDTICSGDTVTFTANPAGLGIYTFYVGGSQQQSGPSNVWSTNQLYNDNIIYVKVTQNGCLGVPSIYDTMTVFPTPFITLALNASTVCAGSNVVATVTPAGLTNYDFYVNSVLNQDSVINTYSSSNFTSGEVISATGTLGQCTSTRSNADTVTVNPIPFVSLASSAAPRDSICQGQPITFTATPPGFATYVFYNGSTVLQDSSASTYTTSTLANPNSAYVQAQNLGCVSNSDTISTFIIPAPAVDAGTAQNACLNDTAVTLTGFTPAGGLWTGQGITNSSGVFTPPTAGVGNHTLTYTYIDPATGCPGDDSIVFTVNALPANTLDSNESVCLGQSIQLTATGGTTYAWSPATALSSTTIANPVASPQQTTVYTVAVTNSSGCSDTASVDVVVNPAPTAGFTDMDVCQNMPTTFTNTSTPTTGVNYLWYFGDGDTSSAADPTHQYANADSFNVTLIVTQGSCPDTFIGSILVYPQAVANFEADPPTGYNDNSSPVIFINQSQNSSAWQWNFGDGSSSALQSPTHVYAQEGTYTVTLVASNQFGCSDSISRPDYINIYPIPKIYIPNVFSPNGDGVNDVILVMTTGVKYFSWSIFDRWGEKVFQSQDPLTGWDGTYKGQKAAQGVYAYYLKVVFEDDSNRDYRGSITLLR